MKIPDFISVHWISWIFDSLPEELSCKKITPTTRMHIMSIMGI